jgi:hypothetical protein
LGHPVIVTITAHIVASRMILDFSKDIGLLLLWPGNKDSRAL